MAELKKIVIDDGTREIPVVNTFGQEICRIHFRPSDWSILDRYTDFVKDFGSIIEPLKQVGINRDGTAEFDKDWGLIKEAEHEIIRRLNALLDADDADQIFAKRNAFSSVNGRFFCEIVLSAIGDLIASSVQTETRKSTERVNKYLSDEAKGGK